MKVLLADDSATMRTLQRWHLAKLGIEDVIEARDGREALEFFGLHAFDLVLTDWNMPHLDGLELVAEIRKVDPEVPVLMVTTEADRSQVVAAIRAGISDYLVKPYSPECLREKLGKWVACPAGPHEELST